MLLQPLEILPVNLVQIAFLTLTTISAVLTWNSKSYKSLAYFYIYQAILMSLNFLEETRLIRVSFLITPALTLIVGPLIYNFVRSIVHDEETTHLNKLLHLSPVILALPFTGFTQTIIAFGSISQIIYLGLSFKVLHRYHSVLLSASADAESMELTWLRKALFIFAIIVVTDLIRLNLQTNINLSIDFKMAWYFTNTLILYVVSLFLLFKVINQPRLFTEMISYETLLKKSGPYKPTDELPTAQGIFNSLDELIKQQALYKQQRLTITDISNKTGLNVKDLSWSINLVSGKNFSEYINSLRIEYLKRQIALNTNGNLKLLDLALESGFGSKSTFNNVFKREVGMTPSEFVKIQQNR